MEFSTIFPGFRFSPTDVELISHYLKRKLDGLDKCDDVIPEVEICKYEPWDLPAKSIIKSDHEWFFFSPSGRKYPNGSQARRATEVGFWKATGKERGIKSGSNVIGTKRTLVFHIGRAPRGERTEWIMHEYCIKGNKVDKHQESFVVCRIRKKQDFSLKNDSHNCDSASNSDGTQVGRDMQHSQASACGEGNAIGCCSKKQKGRLDSLSNEPPDEISIPQHDSEINQEVQDKSDDDCFADILKDDIIKLDETLAYRTPLQSSVVADKPEIQMSSDQSGLAVVPQKSSQQGTAQRRIRMKMHKSGRHSPDNIGISNNVSESIIIQRETNHPVKGLRSKLSYFTANFGLIFMGFVIFSLLVSFLLMFGGTWCFKSFKNLRL